MVPGQLLYDTNELCTVFTQLLTLKISVKKKLTWVSNSTAQSSASTLERGFMSPVWFK